MNLKVVLLVRDPRGIYNSRRTGPIADWCSSADCTSPLIGCKDLSRDVQSAFQLEKKYPGSISLLRYEDLSLEPELTVRRILKFLNLPWTGAMATFIATHTAKEKLRKVRNKKTKKMERRHDPYGTARNSAATAFAWRRKLGFEQISSIQSACSDYMGLVGYKVIKKNEELQKWDLPIEKTAQDIWPYH